MSDPSTPPHQAALADAALEDLMLRGQGNIVGFGKKHPNRTWIEVWETDQQFVLWCLEKLHDGNLSRWGSAKLGHLTSFVTWVKRMGVAEHKAGKTDRPIICRRHEVAMSGPLTAHRETILPQNRGRLFFACPHKCQGCRNNNQCLGGDCCGQDQEGFLWADGSERGSAVSMERKRRYDEEHSQEPTEPAEPPPTIERPWKRSRVTVAAAENEDKDEAVKEKETAEEEPVPEEEKEQQEQEQEQEQEQDEEEDEDREPKAPCPECGVLEPAWYLGSHGGWCLECNINVPHVKYTRFMRSQRWRAANGVPLL